MISFTKDFDSNREPFTLDVSSLNGEDLIMPIEDNPLQAWDFYDYEDYSHRLVSMSWDRELEFPYSVASARADFSMSNTDSLFSPNGNSPIAEYVIPKRPVRLLSGFGSTLLPQFVGLTQGMVDISEDSKIAQFTALDFLTQIYDMPVRDTIAMRDVTTDQVLENIFQQFGLNPTQYRLAPGRNRIRFLFFERETQTAGQLIRELMQAEMGMLWLDENGIIRFKPRLEISIDPVHVFSQRDIVTVGISSDSEIINEVEISSEIREVQDWQTVFIKSAGSQVNVVPPQSSYVFEARLEDPCLSIESPTPGEASGVSWFKATLPNGREVTSGVSVVSTELKTNSLDITFQNTNNFPVDISEMELWGQPAKIINRPIRTMNYPPSIEKYETQRLEISNNFIQSEEQVRSLGLTILDEYSDYAALLDAEVKGNHAYTLGDIVDIEYRQYTGRYKIIGISASMANNSFTQNIKLRWQGYRQWFVLDESDLNGTHLLAP